MKVTTGIRQIIEDWHTKGVSPEETAQSLRIPIDEVKAIILQAHPAPPQPKRPEFLEPHLPALEEPANIGDNRKEVKESTQTVETTPFPTPSKHRGRRSGK